MEQGAVGLSSGLDYIPSLYADQAELTELCREIAPFGGIYVTHMRGYWPHNIEASMNEVAGIGRDAGCGVHISHFNSLAEQAIPLLDAMRSRGVDTTFDLYCYVAGSTILGMVTLPPEVQGGGADATLERLRDPTTVEQLHDWWLKPRIPLDTIRLACVPHADYRQYEGRTLAQAVQERFGEVTPENLGRFVCEILVACDLAVGCVVPHFKPRSEADVKALTRHPAMMGGSDGIFIGARPHPRGTGCFARYLGPYVREGVWSLEEAIAHCSWHAARRYGLSQRGQIQPGWAADLFVFDPATIADTSTYDNGRALAVGVRDVLVNGQFVLRDGQRTSQRPGRGLKRGET
jgi:N-acyl-D-amino-acid deacylase